VQGTRHCVNIISRMRSESDGEEREEREDEKQDTAAIYIYK